MEKLSPIQALEILAQASSMAALPKASHIKVDEAIQILKKLIEEIK